MAFIKIGTLASNQAPILRKEIITNSQVTTVGDSEKLASGFAASGTAGALVFGHVVGIVDNDLGLITNGASGNFTGTYTATSTNQTVAFVKVECDISKMSLYSAEVDATIATTTGSNLAGYRMDLIDEDTLDESTAATTTAQYNTWGVDASDSTKAVVNIYESQVFGV